MVDSQPSNGLNFKSAAKMQIDIDRQKVSRHFNLTFFSISADCHGLLAPEENWKTSFHVFKNITFYTRP